MANLVRREHIFDDSRRNFDHILTRFLSGSVSSSERQAQMLVTVPPIEAWIDQEKKKYHLGVAMPPGMEPEEIQLTLQGNRLTVKGEYKSEREKKKGQYLQQELTYGTVARTIQLPEGVNTDELTPEDNNGVLKTTP